MVQLGAYYPCCACYNFIKIPHLINDCLMVIINIKMISFNYEKNAKPWSDSWSNFTSPFVLYFSLVEIGTFEKSTSNKQLNSMNVCYNILFVSVFQKKKIHVHLRDMQEKTILLIKILNLNVCCLKGVRNLRGIQSRCYTIDDEIWKFQDHLM